MSTKIIPVVHMFNNEFVVASSVSFLSMLSNADKNYFYKLFVLHSDINDINQKKLTNLVNRFENASLEFINIDKYDKNFNEFFLKTKNQSHFSKEIYLKYIVADILKEYDKAIITDVDVVFQGDISKSFIDFDTNEDFYVGACKTIYKNDDNAKSPYLKLFTEDEIKKLVFAGGYYIYNLEKMRANDIPNKFINYTRNNLHRLLQPEQDVINLVCAGKIKQLPVNTLVCTYAYNMYKNNFDNDINFSPEEVEFALKNPIQLHYAGKDKPWKVFNATKSDIFFYYLSQTEFFYDVVNNIIRKPSYQKRIFRLHSRKFNKELVVYLQSRK